MTSKTYTMTKELKRAKEISDDPNMYQYSLVDLRNAAALLTSAGMRSSADNIHIHLRMHPNR